ncbi:unnamed protein product [Porites lobata]|uniref:DED domain-containing protein n=1 Tax=Porites lobata TaxID=104759 RepID=A0ABN8N3W9_9CNID|nr:unnamed protein product [Porites lobata]
MSSQTNNTTIENLQRAYKAVLLQIVRNLEKYEQEELRFFFDELISRRKPGALSIMSSLENAGKISWSDVSFLKEGLEEVKRLDLVEKLTVFEVKRNLTVLLDFYARKRQGMELCYQSVPDPVKRVAGYLLKITREVFQDGFDVSERVRSLLGESKEDAKNLMREFEEKCDQELYDPWSKLTLFIVISGEILAVALANEEHHQKQEVMKLLSTAAESLCSRILKLGNWEEFCDLVTKRYHLVYNQENAVSDTEATSQTTKKEIANVVQHFKQANFFSKEKAFKPRCS